VSALRLGAHAGAPLQTVSFFYFYERNLVSQGLRVLATISFWTGTSLNGHSGFLGFGLTRVDSVVNMVRLNRPLLNKVGIFSNRRL
jgi:hypothetical protein